MTGREYSMLIGFLYDLKKRKRERERKKEKKKKRETEEREGAEKDRVFYVNCFCLRL